MQIEWQTGSFFGAIIIINILQLNKTPKPPRRALPCCAVPLSALLSSSSVKQTFISNCSVIQIGQFVCKLTHSLTHTQLKCVRRYHKS